MLFQFGQTWPRAVTGSMREAFQAGCRLASADMTMTNAAIVPTSVTLTEGDSVTGADCMPNWNAGFQMFSA